MVSPIIKNGSVLGCARVLKARQESCQVTDRLSANLKKFSLKQVQILFI